MTTVTYTVPNITCGNCVSTIQRELGEMAGISRVDAIQDTKQVSVDFNPPATEDAIINLLAEIHYPPA